MDLNGLQSIQIGLVHLQFFFHFLLPVCTGFQMFALFCALLELNVQKACALAQRWAQHSSASSCNQAQCHRQGVEICKTPWCRNACPSYSPC